MRKVKHENLERANAASLIDLGVRIMPMLQISESRRKRNPLVKFLEQIFTQLKAADTCQEAENLAVTSPAYEPNQIYAVIRLIDGRWRRSAASARRRRPLPCPDEIHCGLRILMFDANAISTT
jgi:hypothetical protein